jgi:DNA-binding transcriptional LysR family regulator
MPTRLYTCNSLSIMANLASKGFGLSLLPVGLFQSEMKRGALRILQVKPALPKHHLAIAYRIDPGRPNLKPIRDVCHALIAAATKRK